MDEKRIRYTDNMKATIKAHRSRTGWDGVDFYSAVQSILPSAASDAIGKIIEGSRVVSVERVLYDAVLRAYEQIPAANYRNKPGSKNRAKAPFIASGRSHVITELIEKLDVFLRQQRSVTVILNQHGAPDGLNSTVISNLKSGRLKTLRNDQLEFLEKLLNSTPTKG